MPATKKKVNRKSAAAKKATTKGKFSAAQIVKMRDVQGLSWDDVATKTGLSGSQLRRLYTAGNGATAGTRKKVAKPKSRRRGAAKKATAKRSRSRKATR